ncbi:MAG: hypothetical protein V4519_05145 [Patescibacteria group bacterium]
METKHIIGFVVGIAALLGIFIFITYRAQNPASRVDLSAFTQCLKDEGATFYGAFWCPHCQATKKLFGSSKDNLPYVECSTPDGKGQLPICIEKGIDTYPTWIFKDGSILKGELSLQQLSEKTSCPLPAELSGGTSADVITGTSTTSSSATSGATSTATTTLKVQ